eukprot:m.995530 g.995530  ORF g.995530 m.995530 type:complete len:75 (-) comp24017_c0_seq4:1017-1241(-)
MLAEEQNYFNLTDASSDDEIIGVHGSGGNDNATTPDTSKRVSENGATEKSSGSTKLQKNDQKRGERIKIGMRIK